jgi:hypothetical protein
MLHQGIMSVSQESNIVRKQISPLHLNVLLLQQPIFDVFVSIWSTFTLCIKGNNSFKYIVIQLPIYANEMKDLC